MTPREGVHALLLALTLGRIGAGIAQVDPVSWQLLRQPPEPLTFLGAAALGTALILIPAAKGIRFRWPLQLPLLAALVWPLGGPGAIWWLVVYFGLWGATLFRQLPPFPYRRWYPAALFLLWVLYGGALQLRTLENLNLGYQDWGHYYEFLKRFLEHGTFEVPLVHGNWLGFRFCPALLLLAPYVALFPQPEAFLLLGPLLLGAGGLLVGWAVRGRGYPPGEATAVTLIYYLLPLFLNLNFSLYDGFHELYLAIPLIAGAAGCYWRRQYAPALVLAGLSLLVRETVTLFYLGCGLYWLLTGRRKLGALTAGTALALLLLIVGVLQPALRPEGVANPSLSYFSGFGSSLRELAAAPFRHPGALLSQLFSHRNLMLLFGLLLPLGCGVWGNWRALVLQLPELVVLGLDQRPDSANLTRHYAALLQLGGVLILSSGIDRLAGADRRWRRALLGSGVCAAGVCALFFSQGYGSYGRSPTLADPALRDDFRAAFGAVLPPGVEVNASSRAAAQLVERNTVYNDLTVQEGCFQHEWQLLEGLETRYGSLPLRWALLQRDDYGPVHTWFRNGRLFQLFRRGAPPLPRQRPYPILSETAFGQLGTALPEADPDLDCRMMPLVAPDGTPQLRLLLRLRRPVAAELLIAWTLVPAHGPEETLLLLYGDGCYPAATATPGEVVSARRTAPGPLRAAYCRVRRIAPAEPVAEPVAPTAPAAAGAAPAPAPAP